jgi:hypothetical protein
VKSVTLGKRFLWINPWIRILGPSGGQEAFNVYEGSIRAGGAMFDPMAKSSPKLAWASESDLPLSLRLLIVGALAVAGWAIVILIGIGLLRVFGD